MPSIIIIKNTLKEIYNKNIETLEKLSAIKSNIEQKQQVAAQSFESGIHVFLGKLLDDANPDMLAAISAALKTDYTMIYEQKKSVSEKAAKLLTAQIAENGTQEHLQAEKAEGKRKIRQLRKEQEANEAVQKNMARFLREANAFNRHYEKSGKPLLNAESMDYFFPEKKAASVPARIKAFARHACALMTNSHYHTGRRIIEHHKNAGRDIVALIEKRDDAEAKTVRLGMEIEKTIAWNAQRESAIAAMTNLEKSILTEKEVIESIKQHIDKALGNIATFNAFVNAFADTLPVNIVAARAKAESYKKLNMALTRIIDRLQEENSKIEEPLLKLRRASNRKRNKSIDMDTDGIKEQFADFRKKITNYAASIARTSNAMHNFHASPANRPTTMPANTSALGPLDIYMGIMLFNLLTPENSADAETVHSILGGPDLETLGMDNTGITAPSINADFNLNSSLSVPDFQTSLPDISVPDIPSFESSSSGGGGFDSGGSSYEGGGFD